MRRGTAWRECLPEVHDHTSFHVCDQAAAVCRSLCVRPCPLCWLYTRLDNKQRLLEKLAAACCPRKKHHGAGTPRTVSDIPECPKGRVAENKIRELIDNINARSADPILRARPRGVNSVGAI